MRGPVLNRLLIALALPLLMAGCREVQSQDAPVIQDTAPFNEAQVSIAASRATAITRAVEKATPAVVSITVTEVRQVRVRDPFGDDFYQLFFGRGRPQVREQEVHSVGSGFIISPDGYIVTNDHVAGDAVEIIVALSDGTNLNGRLIGTDEVSDIALIKVESDDPLPYLEFEKSGEILVGEWVIALGNPFGLFEASEPSVTVGVVSGLHRTFSPSEGRVFRDMIQTDASINQGNSGGPLVNAIGEIIGMNTFIVTPTQGSVGIGFAVPATRVARIVDELRDTGSVDRRFYTGLSVIDLKARIARSLDIDRVAGVLVHSVDPESPAANAGFRPYDVITAIGGETVRNQSDAGAWLSQYRVGDDVTIQVLRDGSEMELSLRLARQS